MTADLVVGIVAFAGVPICGFFATLVHFELVDSVNTKLPSGEQFDSLGWYLLKYQRLHSEYRRLYPHGRLLLKFRVLTALMFGCLLLAVVLSVHS